MATDLFLCAEGLDSPALLAAVPPACRAPTGVCLPRAADTVLVGVEHERLIEAPEWTPRSGAVHFVPSLSALTAARTSFRFELSVRLSGAWSPWAAAEAIGSAVFDPLPASGGPLGVDIDEFRTPSPVDAIRLRLRWRGPHTALASPWLMTLSTSDQRPSPSPALAPARSARLEVPAISQMTVGSPHAMRICSPTSVAMVLRYWGHEASALAVAADVFHPATDRYGVWPAAVAAAARHDVAGYLLRFPDWESAAWCLDHGMPIIASVRFAAGELRGAPLAETSGHLIVLTGYDGDWVFVNDPAAAGEATVPRRYLRSDLDHVWLHRSAIAYVLFPPPRA